VVDAGGEILTELTQAQGETFTVADVTLADETPHPRGPQPASRAPFLTYLSSDVLLPALTIPTYRRGLRRTWGEGMAPVATSTRNWTILLGLGVVVSFLVGLLLGRRRSGGCT